MVVVAAEVLQSVVASLDVAVCVHRSPRDCAKTVLFLMLSVAASAMEVGHPCRLEFARLHHVGACCHRPTSTCVRRRAPVIDDGACTHPEPWPTKDTACIGLIGTAERAATAEPEALEAWADDEPGCGLHVTSQPKDRKRGVLEFGSRS